MNRREFLGAGLAAGIYSTRSGRIYPLALPGQTPSGEKGTTGTATWLTEEPTVMAGCWDDFPLFQRRLGGVPTWLNGLYQQQGDDATINALKDAGITLGIIHFFKGFGLNAEHEHILDARRLSRRLKEAGIRVGLYVGSTIAYETFLLEKPDAEAWFVPDFLGKPVYYGDQTFRRRVYFMHPGYREYIKQVVRYGIENLEADLIHFDNTSLQAQPPAFQHPLAIEHFREYLTAKYSAGELRSRFGFSDMRYVSAPKIETVPARINDPLFQEWAEFRCHQLASYYAEMASFIRSMNPSVAVENNPSSGISGRNVIWEQGVDYPRLLHSLDVAWTEEGNSATVTSDGALVSKIRTFKAASKMNKKIFCYTWGADGNWGYRDNSGGLLQMAESMAYNRQCLGMVGIFNAIPELSEAPRSYIRFFHHHFDLYRSVTPVADVALLYSFASMGFNSDRPATSFMLASQMLIQGRFLFDIIFDEHLRDLSQYRVLFLADQECLSDAQIRLISEFVTQGGGLVATEHTSLYTERRERRRDFGLKDCFGVSAPAWCGSDLPEEILPGAPTHRRFGKGTVVYVPELISGGHQLPIDGPGRKHHSWNLAANNSVIQAAILAALGTEPTVQSDPTLSPYVTIEMAYQHAERRLVLHLLNYDHIRTAQVKNVSLRVTLPANTRLSRARALSPDAPGADEELQWTGMEKVSLRVPTLRIYTVLVLELA